MFRFLGPTVAALFLLFSSTALLAGQGPKPNIVLILCDNLGYGDLGCYGSKLHRTPHVDGLAAQGRRFTHFYSASGVCTPSRAALMTGCYPVRVGLGWTEPDGWVLRPRSPNGLHPRETTLAEVLRQAGYRTACIGKWHLGDHPRFLPTRQGFDYYFGIPYSEDMTPRAGTAWPPLPLMENEQVVEWGPDRNLLTRRYTRRAIGWIRRHRHEPFFLFLSHAMPGSTRRPFASPEFQGRSANGPYGDAVEELDHSTGQILAALRQLGLERNTIVIWTSDNGAPRRRPPQGRNTPLAGWGYTTMEGGMRVPFILRWPGHVPEGTTCHELTTMMDLLPTLAHLAGARLPAVKLDGHNVLPLWLGTAGARTPYQAFFYYHTNRLYAVRSGPWKLHLAISGKVRNTRAGRPMNQMLLYHLERDPQEKRNLAESHPQVVQRLLEFARQARRELGDGAPGPGCRPAGRASWAGLYRGPLVAPACSQ